MKVVDEEKKKLREVNAMKKKSLTLDEQIKKLMAEKAKLDDGIAAKRPSIRKSFLVELGDKVINEAGFEEEEKTCDTASEFRELGESIIDNISHWRFMAEKYPKEIYALIGYDAVVKEVKYYQTELATQETLVKKLEAENEILADAENENIVLDDADGSEDKVNENDNEGPNLETEKEKLEQIKILLADSKLLMEAKVSELRSVLPEAVVQNIDDEALAAEQEKNKKLEEELEAVKTETELKINDALAAEQEKNEKLEEELKVAKADLEKFSEVDLARYECMEPMMELLAELSGHSEELKKCSSIEDYRNLYRELRNKK